MTELNPYFVLKNCEHAVRVRHRLGGVLKYSTRVKGVLESLHAAECVRRFDEKAPRLRIAPLPRRIGGSK